MRPVRYLFVVVRNSPKCYQVAAYFRPMLRPGQLSSSRPSVVFPEPPLSAELPILYPAGARWGVVLSHDVDHLGLREHLVDGFLARYAANIARQNLLSRFRPLRALDSYWGIAQAALGTDRWNVIDHLLAAEKRAGVKSTWFIPVRRGRGVAFDLPAAGALARALIEAGHEVGLHGQNSDDGAALAQEVHDLQQECGAPIVGNRMHYLRLTSAAFDGLSRAGVRYDSTVMERKTLNPETMPLPGPRLVRGGVIEFPVHVMDSTLFSATGLGFDFEHAREYMQRLFVRAREEGRLVVINVHPNSYSQQSPEIRSWYDALLTELSHRSDTFITDFRGILTRVQRP